MLPFFVAKRRLTKTIIAMGLCSSAGADRLRCRSGYICVGCVKKMIATLMGHTFHQSVSLLRNQFRNNNQTFYSRHSMWPESQSVSLFSGWSVNRSGCSRNVVFFGAEVQYLLVINSSERLYYML